MVVVEGVMDVGPICLLVRIALSLKEHNNLPSQVSPFCSIFSFLLNIAIFRHPFLFCSSFFQRLKIIIFVFDKSGKNSKKTIFYDSGIF